MKLKDFISSVCFLLVFLVIFTFVSYALRPNDENNSKVVMSGFYAEPKNTLDIVAIGSSNTYRYLMTPELYNSFGYTAYAVTTPSMRGNLYKYMIEEVEKTQNPDLYMIDLRWFVKYQNVPKNTPEGLGRVRLATDNMKLSLTRLKAINKVIPVGTQDRLSYFIDIIKYHSQWQFLEYDKLFYNKKHENKGFRPKGTVVPLKDAVDCSKVSEKKELSEYSKENLVDLLEYCKKKKVNILFTFSPYQVTEEKQMLANTIVELVKSYGFNCMDTNRRISELGMDFDTDFYNDEHTNVRGAYKYTQFIGNYIKKTYNIDNSHNEEVTAEWKKTAEKWNEQKKTKYSEMLSSVIK